MALAYLLAVPLGCLLALEARRRGTRALEALLALVYATPTVAVAMALLSLGAPWGGRSAASLLAAAACLSLTTIIRVSRQQRSSLLQALRADYLVTARAKGGGPRTLIRHALRNALLPVLTLLGGELASLLSGSVIIEQLFGIHGLGLLAFDAVLARDYPTLLGLGSLTAVITLGAVLLVDFTYGAIDPRLEPFGAGSRRRGARQGAGVRAARRLPPGAGRGGDRRRPAGVGSAAGLPGGRAPPIPAALTRPAALIDDDNQTLSRRAAWIVRPPIPYGPLQQRPGGLSTPLEAPSSTHWLGTDDRGRDVLARLLHGTRVALAVGPLAVFLYLLFGVGVGLASASGGALDSRAREAGGGGAHLSHAVPPPVHPGADRERVAVRGGRGHRPHPVARGGAADPGGGAARAAPPDTSRRRARWGRRRSA